MIYNKEEQKEEVKERRERTWTELSGIILLLLTSLPFSLRAEDYPQLPPPQLGPLPSLSSAGTVQSGNTTAPPSPSKPLPAVTISAQVDTPRVPQHERLKYIVTLSWEQPADQEQMPLDFEFPEPPAADGLILYANSFQAATDLSGGKVRVTRTYTYEFYAEKRGATEIKPAVVRYFWFGSADKAELTTQPLPVEVIKPRLYLQEILLHPGALAFYVVIMAAATALVIRRRIKRRQAEAAGPTLPPHELVRKRLEAADRFRLSGDYVEFLRSLQKEMQRYTEEVLGVKIRPPGGLVQAVAEKLGPEWKDRIEEFEKLADRVKFAGYEPKSAELDAASQTARQLVAEGEKLLAAAAGPSQEKNGPSPEEKTSSKKNILSAGAKK